MKYVYTFNAIMPSLQDRGGGIPQGWKGEEKRVVLSLSKLVCRCVLFLCRVLFLDGNHESLH